MKEVKHISLFKVLAGVMTIYLFVLPVTLQGGRGILFFSVISPIELLLTDSQGRRTGFDPLTGEIFQEIPSTSFGKEGIGDDYLENGDQSIPPLNVLENLDAVDGEYAIQLVNPSGKVDSFSLEMDALPADISSNGEVRRIKGVITPDSTVVIKLTYSSTDAKPIQGITVAKKPIQRIKMKAKDEG